MFLFEIQVDSNMKHDVGHNMPTKCLSCPQEDLMILGRKRILRFLAITCNRSHWSTQGFLQGRGLCVEFYFGETQSSALCLLEVAIVWGCQETFPLKMDKPSGHEVTRVRALCAGVGAWEPEGILGKCVWVLGNQRGFWVRV